MADAEEALRRRLRDLARRGRRTTTTCCRRVACHVADASALHCTPLRGGGRGSALPRPGSTALAGTIDEETRQAVFRAAKGAELRGGNQQGRASRGSSSSAAWAPGGAVAIEPGGANGPLQLLDSVETREASCATWRSRSTPQRLVAANRRLSAVATKGAAGRRLEPACRHLNARQAAPSRAGIAQAARLKRSYEFYLRTQGERWEEIRRKAGRRPLHGILIHSEELSTPRSRVRTRSCSGNRTGTMAATAMWLLGGGVVRIAADSEGVNYR